ncbi:hypothetical protein BH09BAC3_BH09BAC3_17350 [soil metagenome]
MDPRSKGWLKEYLEFRLTLLQELTAEGRKSSHPDHSLYRVIQPTGLMYGQPVNVFDHPMAGQWDEKDRMKILLAESLISSSLLFHDKSIKTSEEMSLVTMKTLESITNFYNHVFPELATSTKTLFGRKKTPIELAERILDKRIDKTTDTKGNFWTQFFHNSLLFLDIFIFGQWIHTNADKIVSDFFKYEREELRTSLAKVIAAAAHANHVVEFEERKLMEYFLQSAQLSNDNKKACLDIFENGISVEEINLPTNNSWLLKKYFLEIGILTIWADKKVEESELSFLKRLAETFLFSEDDLEASQIAIEGFVLEHWEELTKLQDKKKFDHVSDEYIKRMARIADKNRSRLIKEVQESEELMDLLEDARSKELDEAEKIRMQKLLIDVLKSIPTLVIISLPQRFLTLPILMQILPKNFIGESLKK